MNGIRHDVNSYQWGIWHWILHFEIGSTMYDEVKLVTGFKAGNSYKLLQLFVSRIHRLYKSDRPWVGAKRRHATIIRVVYRAMTGWQKTVCAGVDSGARRVRDKHAVVVSRHCYNAAGSNLIEGGRYSFTKT